MKSQLSLVFFSLLMSVADSLGFASADFSNAGECVGLTEGSDASRHPELAPSNRKQRLIEERMKSQPQTDKNFSELIGYGGWFLREYQLASGEKIMANGLAEVRGQVMFIRHLVISPVRTKKIWFWHKEYLALADRAQSSTSEMRGILRQIAQEAQSYNLSLLVLEGQRVTGARTTQMPWVQVTVDLTRL